MVENKINEPFQVYVSDHQLTDSYIAAQAAMGRGELDAAENHFATEPTNSPCYGLALGYRALMLFRLDRLKEAEEVVKLARADMARAGTSHPPSAIQFLRTHGDILLRLGRPSEAVPRYRETIRIAGKLAEIAPQHMEAVERETAHTQNALGVALDRLRRSDEAFQEFMAARDTYRKYPNQLWSGLSETLTNLAEACLSKTTPDPIRAEAALAEALDVAKKEGNGDQLWRTRMKLIQLRSKLIPAAERDEIFNEGVNDALRQERWGTAYLRRCIEVQVAAEDGRTDDGLRATAQAHALEEHLDKGDPHPAQLRLSHARLLKQANAPSQEIIKVLIEGAHLWFERLRRPLERDDFRWTTAANHDHFRLLTRQLFDAGRHEEALTAFEAGRALAYAGEVDSNFPRKLFSASNPFERDGSKAHTLLLNELRNSLDEDSVIVVPTVLPPDFVAFVLSRRDVRVARSAYPVPTAAGNNHRATEELFRSIADISHALERDSTANELAIPAPLRALAKELRSIVGERFVRGIAPHSELHKVPWRVLLRESGMPWQQLPCATEFSLLLRGMASSWSTVTVDRAVGLGHGSALGTDFREEARVFVRPFGAQGKFISTCTGQDVTYALSGDHAAIISTHGVLKERPDGSGTEVALELQSSDGTTVHAFVSDLLPEVIRAVLVDLSACSSGVYEMGWGDYPRGVGPLLLTRGAKYCVVCRFPVRATFSLAFSELLGVRLPKGMAVPEALAEALAEAEAKGWLRWRDLACIELLARP